MLKFIICGAWWCKGVIKQVDHGINIKIWNGSLGKWQPDLAGRITLTVLRSVETGNKIWFGSLNNIVV